MALHRHKTLRKILTTVSVLFLTVLFCVSPCAVSRVYAAGSSELSTQAVLSKSNFGTVKKINNAYYIVDEFGNIIDTVSPTAGIDLDRHIGKQILVKDNLFAGLIESPLKQRNSFLGRLRDYLSGIVPKPKIVLPKPKPEPVEPPIGIIVPMYGVQPPIIDEIIIKPIPDPEKPPVDIIVPMYGVQPPIIDEIIIKPIPDPLPMYGVEYITPDPNEKPPDALPMYGVEYITPDPNEKPPVDIIVPMYGVQPPIIDEIIIKPIPDPEKPQPPVARVLYGVEPPYDEIIVDPRPEPIEPPVGIVVPMYGIQPPYDDRIIIGPIEKKPQPPVARVLYGVEPPYVIEPIDPIDGPIEKPQPPVARVLYGVEPPEYIIEPINPIEKSEPIKEELPLRGEPTVRPAAEQTKEQSDKMDVVQKQDADRAELAEKNIKVIPEPSQKKDILNQKKE